MTQKNIHMYISQWALFSGSPGLALFSFDTETGAISFEKQLDSTRSFDNTCLDKEKKILYICNEANLVEEVGYDTGRVYGYRINPEDGTLTELFHRDTFCPFPDYINFDTEKQFMIVPHHSWATGITTVERTATGQYVPVVRFMDSIIDLFTMNPDGTIADLVDVQKHTLKERKRDYEGKTTVPHPHCAVRSPSGKLFAVCDKGDGHVYLYTIDKENRQLKYLNCMLTDAPLSEPRYCTFHPTKPYLFINHEHTGHHRMIVTALGYDEDGKLWPIDKIDCLPPEYDGPGVGQAFCISADGKYLYNLIQGRCAVAVLKIDEETGKLELIQLAEVDGKKPRNSCLSPDGRFLVTACLSGEIVVHEVLSDGTLKATEHKAFLPGSAYVTFFDPA